MIRVYILSGGYSSRFGSDKARVRIGGRELIRSVADELRSIGPITVVADSFGKYGDLGLNTVGDIWPHLGPMGGLLSSILHALRGEGEYRELWRRLKDMEISEVQRFVPELFQVERRGWVLLSACDLAGVKGRWAQRLAGELEGCGESVGAVSFGEPLEPLFAFYRLSVLGEVYGSIVRGERAMRPLLKRLGVKVVAKPADWSDMVPVNRPEDLENFLKKIEK